MKILERLPLHLKYYPIPYGTPEWYKFRSDYIGGSDMGVIVGGINPYNTGAKIYSQKIGMTPPDPDRENMWHGRMLENYIESCWRYYDGGEESILKNFHKGKFIRSSFKFDGYIVNPKYPWIAISPDRFIDKDGINKGMDMVTLQPLQDHGILELKMLSYWGEHTWEDGFPKYYIIQIQTYMLVMETNYAEVAIFHEGNRIAVHPFFADERIQQSIINISKRWYDDHLVPGLAAKKEFDKSVANGNTQRIRAAQGQMQHYEPEPDSSEHYKEFMSASFRRERDIVVSTPGSESIIRKLKLLRAIIKRLRTAETGLKNQIIREHSINKAEYIQYANIGHSRYFKKVGNDKYELSLIGIKENPPDEAIEQNIGRITLTY